MAKAKISTGYTFERSEKKYMLNQYQYELLQVELASRIKMDEYGKHTICNIYYDTEDFSVIRRCREKPLFRMKLRLRSYGIPKNDSTVYLELKKKFAGITYKRRVAMTYEAAQAYMDKGIAPHTDDQIFGEIDWFIKQQPLTKKVVICYDRIAMYDVLDPQLRITFDSNIRWRDYNTNLAKGDYGSTLISPTDRLMEIKTLKSLPYWLSQILAGLQIYPISFSKYGNIYESYLAGNGLEVLNSNNIFGAQASSKEAIKHVG